MAKMKEALKKSFDDRVILWTARKDFFSAYHEVDYGTYLIIKWQRE
jgi:hypothetical protein